ncbi:hypothetical protein [Sphingomonas bacterium]|uniref:hypothetical protein n=1 Tax=Sphingomonas bacterium TaxID=1895847 RepID=UPI001575E101|nr:hypothetical protein [Sphingomonas bacterium]
MAQLHHAAQFLRSGDDAARADDTIDRVGTHLKPLFRATSMPNTVPDSHVADR